MTIYMNKNMKNETAETAEREEEVTVIEKKRSLIKSNEDIHT